MRISLILLLFLFSLTGLKATDFPPVSYLGIENGLSNNLVRSIYQDHNGFMWFGTRDGLNRYDGYGFKVFRNKLNDPHSLVHNIIHVITSDVRNHLWIGTRQGISVYDELSGKFNTVAYHSAKGTDTIREVIKDIEADVKGNVFIGSEGLGLLLCKADKLIADQIPLVVNGKETRSYGVQSLKMDQKGKLWVFVQNLGLCVLDEHSGKLKLINTSLSMSLCMEILGNYIWIGTNNGLFKYDMLHNGVEQMFATGNVPISSAVSTLKFDSSKNLWIGTVAGQIYLLNGSSSEIESLKTADHKNGLDGGMIYSIYIDKESRKWIGTSFIGVGIIDPNKKKFQTIANEPGNKKSLAKSAITAFYGDQDDQLWIGTENSGLNIWNRKTNSFVQHQNIPGDPKSLSGNFITAIISDYKGDVWLGTFADGLNRYNRSTQTFERYKCINPQTGIESKVVFNLYEDRAHTLWAATLRRGSLLGALYRLNRTENKFELFDTKLTDLFVLHEDARGVFWGGNLNQLVKIDKLGKKHQFFNIGYTVRVINEDAGGNFWIGTEGGGLLLFDRKTGKIITRYTTENGLCNNSVLSLLDDQKGNLWISTYNGISKFNIAKKEFTNFYQSDGLQSNQFQINSSLRLKSGEMVFGGIKGFNIFQPASIVPVNNAPNLLLTGLNIDNVPVEQHPSFIKESESGRVLELKVPYDKAVFSFEFTALEYSAADKISYAYYMDGWDRDWNKAGNSRTATYTHMDEGSYVFKVKSTNIEGVWNSKQINLKIVVLPPWYRTWWAYLIYFSAVAALVYLYFLYQSRQTKLTYEVKIANLSAERKKAEYEAEVAKHEKERLEHEKERVINENEKELNEKRLSFFTNISHEFRTPLSLIINPVKDLMKKSENRSSEDIKELGFIHRNARRMLSLIDQLLLFRKAEAGFDHIRVSKLNLYDLCQEVFLCFTQQAASRAIQYELIFENKALEIFADRGKLEIVLFNLISNALKYTPSGGAVLIEVTETTEEVLIKVEDNGSGVPADAGDQLFERFYQAIRKDNSAKPGFGIGLFLAKQFTDLHSGQLSYTSELGKGTSFYLSLLKGQSHFPEVIADLDNQGESVLFNEMLGEVDAFSDEFNADEEVELISDKQSILIVDDEADIRIYIKSVFKSDYLLYEAENGTDGLKLATEKLPDLIITDFSMQGIDGIEFCEKIKNDPALSYIPVILLTASASADIKLKSMEGGADDYISKPFEKEYLVARVANLLKNRNNLQRYFYNEITLQSNNLTISEAYKEFLEKCIIIVEQHLNDADFGIKALAEEIGMSHSNLYKRVKSISGQSVSSFIRFIRLRTAARIMINTDCNVNEAAFQTGFNDAKYFSKQFFKLFHSNPSEFIKKHRKSFNKRYKFKD